MATRTQLYFAEQAVKLAYYNGRTTSSFKDRFGVKVECEVLFETKQVLMNHGDQAVVITIRKGWVS